ncbi:MAG: YncE family protein [Balneolaceae bacterium]|nr:YncE family protein [Balneolaceae bacterium]
MRTLLLFLAALIAFTLQPQAGAQAQTYYVYVAAESDDQVYLVSYNAQTGEGAVEDAVAVGQWPTENEGPHGINISPDGEHWYLSIAHGNPYGWLYKYTTGTNEMVARTELGMFPASMEISRATGLLYVVNFNLHGDHEPSTVSVVDPEVMEEITKIPTGIMPHGSRITEDGRRQYHVSMMTDELMEINTATMKISRRLGLRRDGGPDHPVDEGGMSGHAEMGGMSDGSGMSGMQPEVKPTWADPHPDRPMVYVAGNGSDEILEIDRESWSVTRRFQAPEGSAPYNLEVAHDGRYLVASYKSGGTTGVWNLDSGEEVAVIPNSRTVTHGVSISPDSRFAFISVEGKGGEPGSVDVIDLQRLERTAVIEVGKQAGGIIHWKTER